MTYEELVKTYFPKASDQECDFLLWECTSFPFCNLDTLKEQLKKLQEEAKNTEA